MPDDMRVINTETRCFPSKGIDIGYMGDEGVKVACLRDKRVQSTCGPDGRLTRLQAYREWLAQVQQFQNVCTSKGGSFSYQDPTFVEPHDESFCLQAQVEVGSSMFEDPLCNVRSMCPAVTVVCQHPCGVGGYSDSAAPGVHVTLR